MAFFFLGKKKKGTSGDDVTTKRCHEVLPKFATGDAIATTNSSKTDVWDDENSYNNPYASPMFTPHQFYNDNPQSS